MTTKEVDSLMDISSGCCLISQPRWKLWPAGRYFVLSKTQVVLLFASCLLARAAYIEGSKPAYGSRGQNAHSCKVESTEDIDRNAVAFPGGHSEEETEHEVDTSQPVSTTGQRVAGHLLAVLLLASVAAAIIEVVRARMAQCKSPPKTSDGAGTACEAHHSSSSVHGGTGRIPRRAAVQEKSQSQDSYVSRARSNSAEVTSNQEGTATAAAAALATSRAQKALRARLLGGRPLALGGKIGAVPPLLRRSSFPVMTRNASTSGRDSNSGSPRMMSRKQSMNDSGDDEAADFQKRRVRIIRRF